MSTSKKSGSSGRRRAADLPVRRWLQLGAASAGMGAALIGWSLIGSDVGVASADTGVESSSSAGPAATAPKGGVDSGSAGQSPSSRTATPSGRAAANESRDDAASTTSRRTNRTEAAATADVPAKVEARSNRVAAAETAPAANKPTNVTNGTGAETLQDSGTQLLGGGGAAPLPTATAGVRDGLGALAKLLAEAAKKASESRPLHAVIQNKLEEQLPKKPQGLLDLIPKTRYKVEDPLGKAIQQAKDADNKRRADEKTRQIDEIEQKGIKLTARDGTVVYTTDGRTFIRDGSVISLDRIPRNRVYETNVDIVIKNNLKLDPAEVRSLWDGGVQRRKEAEARQKLLENLATRTLKPIRGVSGWNPLATTPMVRPR